MPPEMMSGQAPPMGGMMPQGQQGGGQQLPPQLEAMIASRIEGLNRMLEGMGLGALTPQDAEQITMQIVQSLQQGQGGQPQPGMTPPNAQPPRPPIQGGMQPPGGGYGQ